VITKFSCAAQLQSWAITWRQKINSAKVKNSFIVGCCNLGFLSGQ
jgi:hypothetical protein